MVNIVNLAQKMSWGLHWYLNVLLLKTKALITINMLSACIYVEAREVESKFDWVGSNNTLAYPLNPIDSNSIWALGISTNVGYVTNCI